MTHTETPYTTNNMKTTKKLLAVSKNWTKKHENYTRLSCNIKQNILNYTQYWCAYVYLSDTMQTRHG